MKKQFRTRLERIRLLASDVDGVLTDGGVYYTEHGDELKKFNVHDGMGMVLLQKAGIRVALITAEETKIVERRALKLKITEVFQGSKDKVGSMEILLKRHGLRWEEVAFIGDDVNDFELLKRVGFSATPANGTETNKKIVHYVTKHNGGDGCVREICDLLLEAQKSVLK
jgi:YrbI family 3-deoxy-D-manno-octulosonate 8-phosphate phosphatase